MKKLLIILLAALYCNSYIGSVYAAALQKGEIAYTRSNLGYERNMLFWHNMSSYEKKVPVGTEVKIEEGAGGSIAFAPKDTNKTLYIVADPNSWEKYFVKDKKDIGLDGLPTDKKNLIEGSAVIVGMSKKEVYASKGCPAYIAWGIKSNTKSLAEIMQSDKWYYQTNKRGHDVMVTFQGEVVVKTGVWEKK